MIVSTSTPPPNTVRVWVVDTTNTALLCDQTEQVAVLTFSTDILNQLNTHQWATLQATTIKDHEHANLPNVIIELSALVQFGILKTTTTQNIPTYSYNHKPLSSYAYRELVTHISTPAIHHLCHAIQLMRWKNEYRYCSRCGTKTTPHPSEYASVCPACRYRHYPKVQPCVIVAITRTCPTTGRPQLLLALHHRHCQTSKDNDLYLNMHSLIAGFVEIGESLETAVTREVQEEVGLQLKNIRYLGSQPWPYPTNLMIGFMAEWAEGEICIDDHELIYAQFFDLDALPALPMQGSIARTLIDWVVAEHRT